MLQLSKAGLFGFIFLVFTDVMLKSDRYSDIETLTASVGVRKPLVALIILIKSVVFLQCNVSLY